MAVSTGASERAFSFSIAAHGDMLTPCNRFAPPKFAAPFAPRSPKTSAAAM
jgi:hypothetical protein